jgi:hypothetical protein
LEYLEGKRAQREALEPFELGEREVKAFEYRVGNVVENISNKQVRLAEKIRFQK